MVIIPSGPIESVYLLEKSDCTLIREGSILLYILIPMSTLCEYYVYAYTYVYLCMTYVDLCNTYVCVLTSITLYLNIIITYGKDRL